MNDDFEFEQTLRRLAGPVDRRDVWAGIEARAGRREGATARAKRHRTHVAVYATLAVVLVAAIAVGSFEAVSRLTHAHFVLAITDETMTAGGGTASGDKWEPLPLAGEGMNITSLVIDPTDPSVLYAGTDEGLFKSIDAARTWKRVASLGGKPFHLAVDPASSSTVFALTDNAVDPTTTRFFRSDDGGLTWRDLTATSPHFAVWPPIVLIDATTSPSTVYTFDLQWSMWRSTDRGESWTRLSPEVADRFQQTAPRLQGRDFQGTVRDADTGSVFTEVAGPIDPSDPSIEYAGTPEGVYKSIDGGKTWKRANAGLTSVAVWQLVPDPRSSSILYASTSAGIFKTSDGGETWKVILPGQGSVVLAPSSPSTLYAWTSAGLFRSDDAGGKWAELTAAGLTPKPSWWGPTLDGLLLVAPQDPDTVFAISGDDTRSYVFRSTDGGNRWGQVLEYGGSLVADPQDPSVLYAVRRAQEGGKLCKSTDLGSTWTVVSPKEWVDPIWTIAVDPHAPAGVSVLQKTDAGLFTVSRSVNGGATWDKVALEGLGLYIQELAYDPHSAGTLYVLTAEPIGKVMRAGIYRSVDGGLTWGRITGGLADAGLVRIEVDPAPGGALYAVTERGVFKWVPSGK
jgi:photosystem II stability/assembly factor-like uncharacterized protein